MKKQLRSNFEPGTSRWAVRRAQWRALGLTDEDMEKPKIAVVNTSSELSICFSHVDGVAKVVKDAIRAAGGLPFEIRTMAVSDFITSAGRAGTFLLPSRDLITNDIEVQVEGAQLDGMILLSSCDKTPPAHLMAAGRFNIPSILVMCGYQASGEYKGKHVDIEDVFLGSVQASFGKLSAEDLQGMANNAIRGPGVCSGMATANSLAALEAGVTVVLHAGDSGLSSDGYAVDGFAANFEGGWKPSIKMFAIEQAVHLWMLSMMLDNLPGRYPNLRIASVENGAEFLPDLFRKLRSQDKKIPGWFGEDPVDQFRRHVWINPFWEDDLDTVVSLVGADRVIFGSDWPHIEGMPEPLDYVVELKAFDDVTRKKILLDNATELNELRPA